MTRESTTPHTSRHICQPRAGTVRFGDKRVLNGVDLVIGCTERVALIGENGAGKSTLLGARAGSVELAEGLLLREPTATLALAERWPRPWICCWRYCGDLRPGCRQPPRYWLGLRNPGILCC